MVNKLSLLLSKSFEALKIEVSWWQTGYVYDVCMYMDILYINAILKFLTFVLILTSVFQ